MKKLIALFVSLVPSVTFAQAVITDLGGVTGTFTGLVKIATQILITIAVLYIIINVVRYLVIGGSDPEKRALAGSSIMYGIIGLFVILSIWGLVNILVRTFRTDNNIPTDRIPQYITPGQITNF